MNVPRIQMPRFISILTCLVVMGPMNYLVQGQPIWSQKHLT